MQRLRPAKTSAGTANASQLSKRAEELQPGGKNRDVIGGNHFRRDFTIATIR
jgi:hypothetical protein